MTEARFLRAPLADAATGPVVIVDVLRAFTTAAYAFAVGAERIWLVEDVAEALLMKSRYPGMLAMGEDEGRRVIGFDFANSPAEIARQDLRGRELVQRTSAGTRGVVSATSATRRWCASLVCASATAAAVLESGLGIPDYVITGWVEDDRLGQDDMATACLIERVRTGLPANASEAARTVANSSEAARTLSLSPGHADAADVELATSVDAFDFAMQARQTARGLELTAQYVSRV